MQQPEETATDPLSPVSPDANPVSPNASPEAAAVPAAEHSGDLRAGETVKRHRVSTRLWHWTNALALFVMLLSGLMIFNAHPRLYWGQYGANFDHAWFEIGSHGDAGFAKLGALQVKTTGLLGVWPDAHGVIQHRAFPYWLTIPSTYSLAHARLWHLAFAWILGLGLVGYLVISLVNGHARRDLAPTRHEIAPAHIWQDIKDHARLRFPTGAEAARYNILQKLSYGLVLFVLLPLIIFTGLTMSPQMDSGWSFLLSIFGGRQSARSIHFIVAWLLVGFFFVHVVMVVLAGPINEVRSMITGRYRLPREKGAGS
ncbi:MAG: cytochrome b/b6 domain-containing protein [Sphingomicrobium sp.]